MSLTQQLLVRTLIANSGEPYRQKLICWGTGLHDRFMLPHFAQLDWEDVVRDLARAGYAFLTNGLLPTSSFAFLSSVL